jgi:dihydroorotase-like cyclic amidohydrolase
MRQGVETEWQSHHQYPSVIFYGSLTDVHMHPRRLDYLFPDKDGLPNGKAGTRIYTASALLGGFTTGLFMPNEHRRLGNPNKADGTELIPAPTTTLDLLLEATSNISESSLIEAGVIFGVDTDAIGVKKLENGDFDLSGFTVNEIDKTYSSSLVNRFTAALKIYGANTTGGYNIPLETIVPVAKTWYEHNPTKPIILHLEDGDVARVLEEMPPHIPVHIAHVSSKQELEAVIAAKQAGKNATCEATPHHLFLTEKTREEIGPYGCMKPTLKSEEDRKFLWDNLEYIDIFASDCAPHRAIDKAGIDGKGIDSPAFGVTNHDVFMPLFLQAVLDGKLTLQQLYDRVVTNPRERFNLPATDTRTKFVMAPITAEEATQPTPYGESPFIARKLPGESIIKKSSEVPSMRGKIIYLAHRAGAILIDHDGRLTPQAQPGYENLIQFSS